MVLHLTSQILLFLWELMFSSGCEVVADEHIAHMHMYEGADYLVVASTTLFVDKSLLIKSFVESTSQGSGILILAPRHFGKSTNLNMVKRFFSINVDGKGSVKDARDTSNYNLFRNNYLNIYNLKDFFSKHFGKYPVIWINYASLSYATSYKSMLEILRTIILETFHQHEYLFSDKYLGPQHTKSQCISKQNFEKYINPELSFKVNVSDVQAAFTLLSKLLHIRFGKRVIVLIDNYDAFVDSPFFVQNPKESNIVRTINYELLRSESVERSMVTGVIRSSGPSLDRGEILPPNVVASTADHNVWTYYGLSGVELDRLLQPIVGDDKEREEVIGKIVSHSGNSAAAFNTGKGNESRQDRKICSVRSVMKYFSNTMVKEDYGYVEYDYK